LHIFTQTYFFAFLAHSLWGGLPDLVQDLMHGNTSIWCVFSTCKTLAITISNTLHTLSQNIFLRISSPFIVGRPCRFGSRSHSCQHINLVCFSHLQNTCNNDFKYFAHTFAEHISSHFYSIVGEDLQIWFKIRCMPTHQSSVFFALTLPISNTLHAQICVCT
jgi:hypothetical protein